MYSILHIAHSLYYKSINMTDALYTYALNDGRRLKVFQDDNPDNPRDDDNLCVILARHRNYRLSDSGVQFDGYGESFDNDFAMYCQNKFGAEIGVELNDNGNSFENDEDEAKVWEWINEYLVWEKLYLYDHSGITISTSRFSCQWDSGQIGFVYIEKKIIKENWEGTTPMEDKEIMTKGYQVIKNEVDTFDKYLTGDVYGYQVEKQSTWTCDDGRVETEWELDDDSCRGFYDKKDILDEFEKFEPKEI